MLKRLVGHSSSMDTVCLYLHDVDGELESAAKLIIAAFYKVLKDKK